jgi:hypothetical protein
VAAIAAAAKAAAAAEPEAEAAAAKAAAVVALREELQSLRPSALRKRAVAEGVPTDAILDLADMRDPAKAIVELIVQEHTRMDAAAVEAAAKTAAAVKAAATKAAALMAMRRELQSLKPSALRRRAVAEGVPTDEIHDAEDRSDPAEAIVELIMQRVRP